MNLILIATLIAALLVALVFILTYSQAIYTNWKRHRHVSMEKNLQAVRSTPGSSA